MTSHDYSIKAGETQKAVPAGTAWTITESGQWEVPATGQYQVELHGGGGGAAIDFPAVKCQTTERLEADLGKFTRCHW